MVRLIRFALAFSTLVVVSELGGQVTLDSAVKTLKPGETVRIRVRNGGRIESRIASLQTEPLGLKLADASTVIDVGAIDSLWVRGDASRAGPTIGAVVAGLLSLVFWGEFCNSMNEGSCDQWGRVIAYSAAGAGAGALIGRGLGGMAPKWRLRFARALP